jgi:CheY-like chemotaxis protein
LNATAGESGSSPSPDKDQPSTSLSPPEHARKRPRILIVEDSKTDVFLIREAISAIGIDADIDLIRDGHSAARYFDDADASQTAQCPDLVLLDLNLPKTSGHEVLERLRASASCRSAKVLVVSSSGAPADRDAAEQQAVSGYFTKPSDYVEFMKLGPIIKSLLEPL